MEVISSPRNRRVVGTVRLHRKRGRDATGTGLLEGPKLLAEAAAGGAVIRSIFGLDTDTTSRRLAAEAGAEWLPVTEAVLRRMATTGEPQSPVAVFEIPAAVVPGDGHLLAAWGIADPGNAGTLIRIAAAFGMAFVAGPGTADPWSPKVLRSAAGVHWETTVGTAAHLSDLRGSGRVLVATVVSGGEAPQAIHDHPEVCLLIGGEAAGLPSEIVEAADLQITIPMPGGTESLNAAMAGAILAYEAVSRPTGTRISGD